MTRPGCSCGERRRRVAARLPGLQRQHSLERVRRRADPTYYSGSLAWSAPVHRSMREHTYLSATGAYREDPLPAIKQNVRPTLSRRKPKKNARLNTTHDKFNTRLTPITRSFGATT